MTTPETLPDSPERITHMRFSQQAAYLASRASSWAGEVLILPEDLHEPMRPDSLRRFSAMLRETADMIEGRVRAATRPVPAVEGLLDLLREIRECCLIADDDGITVTEDPHLHAELFDKICAALAAYEESRK